MSNNIIFALMYHRHKLLDQINKWLQLTFFQSLVSVRYSQLRDIFLYYKTTLSAKFVPILN
jgi:hypothetical protein